ncbi:recombinase family protein [Roseomonas sp. JC162]|uniref:Recombinase family protein n=1 Tax=Neoroseomonas marina TaxID=1232220 RepID=A0A848EGH6_9PROT|nr:recombinase family protein [Neoroseomonas marina]NMJ42468.1 recombinase family protein [Neoroseomonas marina]
MTMRCLIYARFSSDLQSAASIEDQFRICHERAAREGWSIVGQFSDAAISGATLLRPGYQGLLEAIRTGKVDIVLAESLDRFSRDLEHVAAFHKQATFCQVRIVTLAEGEISELHVGLKGTMGALYLKDLAAKTHRGQVGRVRKGFAFGAPPYGYRKVRRFDEQGEPVRGLREIDPAEAAVVRRIFGDYVAGHSPRTIAAALNAEGIPGPAGTPWYDTGIRGRAQRGDGILRNPIYAGRLRWNRSHQPRDPLTGRHVRRKRPPEEVVEAEVPELRIVDDTLWERAQARLSQEVAPENGRAVPAFWERRRPKHLVTGKVVCGTCGGTFAALGRDYLGCQRARRGKGCSNTRRVRRPKLEAMIMEALGSRLMRPDLVAAFCRAFVEAWNGAQAEAAAATAAHRLELQGIQRKLDNLVEAIAEGVRAPGVQRKLEELESRRGQLLAAVKDQPAPAPALLPNLAEVYADRVAVLRTAIEGREDPEVLEAARALIDKVIVSPGQGPDDPPEIELVGQLVELLRAGGVNLTQEDTTVGGVLNTLSAGSEKEDSGGGAPP